MAERDEPMSVTRALVGDDGSEPAAAARSWAELLAAVTGADVVVAVERGDGDSAAAGLLARAQEEHADLVVVGRRGAGGFPGLQLGSTAHQVTEHATVPVAVVPAAPYDVVRANPAAEPGEPGRPLARLAVGLDGSPGAAAAAAWAAAVAARASGAVWAVHAADIGPAFAAAGVTGDAYAQATRTLSERLEHEWSARLRAAGVLQATLLEEGGAATVLLHVAQRHALDLLVVGRRGVDDPDVPAMGSVAHRVVAFAPCPTVVVPPAAYPGRPAGS